MCDELLALSVKYGYDTIPDYWKSGNEKSAEHRVPRYMTRFSPQIFSLAHTELISNEGIDILLDSVVSAPVMEQHHCKGLIIDSKSGREFYPAKIIIDTTGDGDILYRAGVPTVLGKKYFTYVGHKTDIDLCKKVTNSGKIQHLLTMVSGGNADLYDNRHNENIPLYSGTTANEVTEYILKNQKVLLDNIRNDQREYRDIVTLPTMPQFRTTRRIKGDYTLTVQDEYRHFDDSIGAICDFDHADVLYEVPYRCLINSKFDNLITAGRSADASGYAWDVLRAIPPAIITGQAAGVAAAQAIDENVSISDVNISEVQANLDSANVMMHFDDKLIPTGKN